MRYENKFVFESSMHNDVLNQILMSPAFFSEIYYERRVNNIYLDNFELNNYFANINGEQNRVKQRIRWYGDITEVKTPVLEYKIKHGDVGKKEYYDLPDFELSSKFDYKDYLKEVGKYISGRDESYVQMYNVISQQLPTLYNSYYRRYFLSGDGKYRMTIDRNMCFTSISESFYLPYSFDLNDIVVELKYNEEDIEGANGLLQSFNFRLSRNSKYVNGISALYFNQNL